MRILHTSDWHLGRTFHGVDLTDAHRAFLDHLVTLAVDEQVDAVLVAGDVYDRAVPGPEALELLDRTADRLTEAGIHLVATSGNHDSFMRLGHARKRLDATGVHVRTRLSDIAWPTVLTARSSSGSSPGTADDFSVAVYGIPYLEPGLVHDRWGVARTHEAVLTAAMDRIRAHHSSHHPGAALVVAAHAFVGGAQASESERDISVGSVGIAPLTVFSGADYVALGHLHRPQALAPTVRYSGSPLPYSFGEAAHPKSTVLVDITGDAVSGYDVAASAIPLPQFRPVRTLTGTLEDVLRTPVEPDALVEALLTDPVRVPAALGRLRAAFDGLIRYEWVQAGAHLPDSPGDRAAAHRRTETEVFRDFVREATGAVAGDALVTRFESALVTARSENR